MSSTKKKEKKSFASSLWKFLTGERPGPSGYDVAMCLYRSKKARASVEAIYAQQDEIALKQNKIKALRIKLDSMSRLDPDYRKLSLQFDRLVK